MVVGTCVSHVRGRAMARPYTGSRLFAQSDGGKRHSIGTGYSQKEPSLLFWHLT